MQKALRPLWFLLALIVLFESWVWHKFITFSYFLVRLLPFEAFKRGVRRVIDALPPWATLVVFAVPLAVVEPMKLVAVYFLTHGHFVLGVLGFIALKFIAFALIAFMFELCRDKLLQLKWFVKVYEWIVWGEAWAHRLIDPYKTRVKQMIADARLALAPAKAWLRERLGAGRGPVTRYVRALRMRWRRS